MALRETLQRMLTEYAKAKVEPLENHPLAQFIRHDAAQAVEAGLGELGAGLVVEGSPGQGNWEGKIDDLAIWTRALSSQELAGIYNAGLAGQPLLTLIPEPSVMAMFSLGILMVAGIRSARK